MGVISPQIIRVEVGQKMEWISGVTLKQFSELTTVYGEGRAFARILGMLEAAGCKTIAIDEAPVESEYAEEYKIFYSKVFEVEGKKNPTRLHFFDGIIASESDVTDDDPRYFGYCDLRPTPRRSVSSALIDSRVFIQGNSNFLFLICQRRFSIQFGNKKLTVRAFPYVQQDGAVIRCAQAALASMSNFFGSEITGPQFTQIAASIPSHARPIPSSGLNPQAIGLCFQKMDKEPVFYDYTIRDKNADSPHPEQIIYRYLESGIPVLLGIRAGCELHALVVIGHSFTPDSWLAQTSTLYYSQPKTGRYHHCSTNWIERFIVQDDNLGPYTLAPASFAADAVCQLVMVPLEPGVHFMAEEAESFTSEFFNTSKSGFLAELQALIDADKQAASMPNSKVQPWPEENAFWFYRFCQHAMRGELVLRTNLRTKEKWLDGLKELPNYTDISTIVEMLPLPERVWVVELSWPDLFVHGRRFCGEMVLDPTALLSPTIPMARQMWLCIRVPGILAHRNVKNGNVGAALIKSVDMPQRHFRSVENI